MAEGDLRGLFSTLSGGRAPSTSVGALPGDILHQAPFDDSSERKGQLGRCETLQVFLTRLLN